MESKCKACGKTFLKRTYTQRFCSFACQKKESNKRYKDKSRHGKKREELLNKNGYTCSKCGKEGNRYQIVAHHVSFDKHDHETQVLLCRSCHAKEHGCLKSPPLRTLNCEVCGVEFTVRAHRAKYCSKKCSTASQAEKNRERVRRWKENNPERVKANKKRYYLKKRAEMP